MNTFLGRTTLGVLASFGVLALLLVIVTWPLPYFVLLIVLCEVFSGRCF